MCQAVFGGLEFVPSFTSLCVVLHLPAKPLPYKVADPAIRSRKKPEFWNFYTLYGLFLYVTRTYEIPIYTKKLE
jgi:hypothetical protein